MMWSQTRAPSRSILLVFAATCYVLVEVQQVGSRRYTENGENQQLGSGVWRRGVQVDFWRHVFDEARCSSITQAVLSSLTGAVVFGVRLLYRDGQLLEVEAHVVPETLARIDVDMIIPIGSDRFVEPVVEERRIPSDACTSHHTVTKKRGEAPAPCRQRGALGPAAHGSKRCA